MHKLEGGLDVTEGYVETLAQVAAITVENINMQMEAETADMIDRRMMQLFAVAHKKFEKCDV